MELDEMKTAWKELDGRLGRQEAFNETFIRESITSRSQKSVNRFLIAEAIGFALVVMIIPFVVWRFGLPSTATIPGMKLFMTIAIVLLPLIVVWQAVKLVPLFRIDMSRSVKDNARQVKIYDMLAMSEKRFGYFLMPLLFVAISVQYVAIKAPLWAWVFLIAMVLVLGVLYPVWYYKKFYKNNIGTMKKGLDELKELNGE